MVNVRFHFNRDKNRKMRRLTRKLPIRLMARPDRSGGMTRRSPRKGGRPEPDLPIGAAGGQEISVRGERDAGDWAASALQGEGHFTRPEAPEFGGAVQPG
jgi:hypothetical protein